MKNKIKYKNTIRLALIFLLIFNIIFVIILSKQYKQYEINTNIKVDNIISNVLLKYPNVSKEEIIDILTNDSNHQNILKEYGIDLNKDVLILKNRKEYKINTILNMVFLVISNLIIILIFAHYNRNKNKELNEITKYIEEINKRNYKLNIDDNTEDELAILKNELYKITVYLKEESENLKNDKKELKNAIEDISHQLKTPLTSILILLDNILEDKNMLEEVKIKFLNEIKNKILKINSLVYSLLKLAKFETNTIIFKKENVKLIDLIKNAIKNVNLLSKLKDIKIEINMANNIIVNCDISWQEEAISNIIKNAIEHANKNSIIKIRATTNNLYSKLEITNYGEVISEKDQKYLFNRFYKCSNSPKESMGIGLNLTKTIIEKDNGIISVSSSKEKGTTFTVKYFKNGVNL